MENFKSDVIFKRLQLDSLTLSSGWLIDDEDPLSTETNRSLLSLFQAHQELKCVTVSDFIFNGNVVEAICSLPKLEKLQLKLSDQNVLHCTALSQSPVSELHLYTADLSGTNAFSEIFNANNQNLYKLTIHNSDQNTFDVLLISAITQNWTNLRSFTLEVRLSGDFSLNIILENLLHLEYLKLPYIQNENRFLYFYSGQQYPNLKTLHFDLGKFEGRFSELLNALPNLEDLNIYRLYDSISYPYYSLVNMQTLAKMKKLKKLCVSFKFRESQKTIMTDEQLSAFNSLTSRLDCCNIFLYNVPEAFATVLEENIKNAKLRKASPFGSIWLTIQNN